MKRMLSIFLVLCICMTLVVTATGEGSLSTAEKAGVLYQMSILTGDGKDFKLNNPLIRCEAVAFIVRILGNEDYVQENKDEFKETLFPDVPANMWYAPYVGYCSDLGIISGIDGKFNPEGNISEKSFLKLLLEALGYKLDTDYTWNSVYRAAYEIGLVRGDSYMSKVDDNLRYTRSGAVDALYNALSCRRKDSDSTLIRELVDEGIVDREDAVLAGLLDGDVDAVPAAIDSVNVSDSKRISVVFNEPVEDIAAENIKIYETASPKKTLSAEVVSLSGNELVLKTSGQTPDMAYTIEISDVSDSEGNVTDLLKGSFTGYKAVKVESDFFRVSGVEAAGGNLLNVYFTHPVNANAEYPGYYEIFEEDAAFVQGGFGTMTVKCLENGKNGVAVYLKDRTFADGVRYTLRAGGSLVSRYGTRLNEGVDETAQFYGVSGNAGQTGGASEEGFSVDYIYAMDKSTIEIGFNMEVDKFFAKQFVNYAVYAPDNTSIAVNKATLIEDGDYMGKCVRLGLQAPLDRTKEYELYINFLPDISKKLSIAEKRFRFSGQYPEASDLKILGADAYNRRLVVALLDKPLDASSAENASYYTIMDTSNNSYAVTPAKVRYDVIDYNYIVRLYLPADKQLSGSKNYKLRISRAMPYNLGSTSLRDAEYSFYGTSTEYENPAVSEALIVGSDTIKVVFAGEIGETVPNISVRNYTLEYNEGSYTVSKIPLSVTYIDPLTIILRFDGLDYNTAYRLKAREVRDYAGISSGAASGAGYVDVKMGKQ